MFSYLLHKAQQIKQKHFIHLYCYLSFFPHVHTSLYKKVAPPRMIDAIALLPFPSVSCRSWRTTSHAPPKGIEALMKWQKRMYQKRL